MAPPASSYVAVVAIDFGTSRTGYAFAFTACPTKIYPNKTWPGGPPEGKTLTEIVLKKSDHSTVAFGHAARDFYASLDPREKQQFLYFSQFKMTLHNIEGASRKSVKACNCDEEIPVKKLIRACIDEVKKKAMEELMGSSTFVFTAANIQWVITVPAIWDTAARQAMKDAAVSAGLPDAAVNIALEPECAAIWSLKNQSQITSFHDKSFMVIDGGGGTVDITVHKMKPDETLAEIHPPSGGNWGSTYVDKEFVTLLEKLLGKDHVAAVRNTCGWIEVMEKFENVKLNSWGSSIDTKFKNINIGALGGTPNIANIREYNSSGGKVELLGNILRLSTTTIAQIFRPTIGKICRHVQELLANPACSSVKLIFLVGGFAENQLLQASIKGIVGTNVKLITPPRPGSSVVLGAVHYGLYPDAISLRISPTTIGHRQAAPWDPTVHFGRSMICDDEGRLLCDDGFRAYIQAGDEVPADCVVSRVVVPILKTQTAMNITIYSSTKKSVVVVPSEGSKEMGALTLQVPEPNIPVNQREVRVDMKFGGTTFNVEATYIRSGSKVSATFDFPLE